MLGMPARAEIVAIDTADLEPQVASLIEASIVAVQQDPKDAEVWGHLGMVLHAHGLHLNAGDSYVRAASLNPQDYRWLYLAALASSAADEALEFFAKAYRLNPNDYSLCIAYGDALTRIAMTQQASRVYRRAQALEPDRGYAHLGLARLAFMQGDLEQARTLLTQAGEASPRNSEVHVLLAQVLYRLGAKDAAVRAESRAKSTGNRLRPKSEVVEAMQRLGVSVTALQDQGARLVEQSDFSGARAVFERVVALQTDRGDLTGAASSLRRIHELQPQGRAVAFDLATLLATTAKSGSAETAEALRIAESLYRSNRRCAKCADLLGIAYAANDRFQDASRLAQRARELAGEDADLAEAIDRHMAGYAEHKRVMHPLDQ
jgi:tetratricopeptide (TPR) repeat protein